MFDDERSTAIIFLLMIVLTLTISRIAAGAIIKDYEEQVIQLNNEIDGLEIDLVTYEGRYNTYMLVHEPLVEEHEALKEWAINTYCEITVGNAHITFRDGGSSIFRSRWYMFIDNEYITRPPILPLSCSE